MTSMNNLRASKMSGPAIRISCQPPSHGWLTLTVLVDGQTVEIDASDEGRDVVAIHGSPAQILMPFWRLVRQFQSHESKQQHWPHTDLTRVLEVKGKIKQAGGESVE